MSNPADTAYMLVATIHGHVQGVCCRATVMDTANKLGITRGRAHNNLDGSVRVTAFARTKRQLEMLLSEFDFMPRNRTVKVLNYIGRRPKFVSVPAGFVKD